jgi:hypothetical protein
MSTLTDTYQPPRIGSISPYLAGTGATSALVAGALVVFLSVAAFVGFNGLPFGGTASQGTVRVGTGQAGAPEAAALALAGTPVAVAPAPTAAVAPDGTLVPPAPTATDVPGGAVGPPGGGGGGGDDPTVPPPTTTVPGTGPVGGIVDGVDNTTGDLGLDLGLGDLTDPITRPVDGVLTSTLNGAGSLLGARRLGDGVSGALGGVTTSLLGR